MAKDKAIKISSDFKDFLDGKGRKAETYEDILKRMISKKKSKFKLEGME